ncbi:MAG: ABC transporter ATP-binding protein [Balneolaceae bacterium]|nr:ABC transporter ATP-binding protein [Balneolaceae bacterium]
MFQIKELTKQFKAGRPIFSGFSKTVEAGKGIGLVGPNGSGKTTFLRILSVNSFPTSGSVEYQGIDIHKKPNEYLNHVGLVHDEETLPIHLSASELLEWVLRSRKMWNSDGADAINSMLDQLSLVERDEPIGTYSTGMKKKTQIAAALIINPEVLIMDEPLRGLDDSTRSVVTEILDERKKKQNSLIFMSSHTMGNVQKIFDEILSFPLPKQNN